MKDRVIELASGAVIFVPAANRQTDGTLEAQRGDGPQGPAATTTAEVSNPNVIVGW